MMSHITPALSRKAEDLHSTKRINFLLTPVTLKQKSDGPHAFICLAFVFLLNHIIKKFYGSHSLIYYEGSRSVKVAFVINGPDSPSSNFEQDRLHST